MVRVVGRVDRAASIQLSGWIRGLIAAGAHNVVVDVSGATGCDARILTVLSRASARLAADGESFTVVGLQLPEFIDVLPRATLDEVFIVYDVIRRESGVQATRGATPRQSWRVRPSAPSSRGRHRR